MSCSKTMLLFLLAGPAHAGCAGKAPASTPPAPEGAPPEAPPLPPADEPAPDAQVSAEPATDVVEIEIADLGPAPTITAPPRRPTMPSMMSDIVMAPSR